MTNRHTLGIVSALVTLGAGLAGCAPSSHSAPPQEASSAKRTAPPVPVTVVAVQAVPAAPTLRASGRVTHDHDLKLGFKTGGVIKEVLVDEGDRVTAGQIIARLDPREIDAAVAAYSAGVSKAQRDLARAEDLAREAVIPGSTRDDARTAARVASAQLAGARFNRETATLVATANGVVLKRFAAPGEVIGPGMPVVVVGSDPELAAPGSAVLVEAAFPAREAALIEIGDQASVRFDGRRDAVPGTVRTIAPALEPGSDHVLVRLLVDANSLGRVPRGLVAEVTLTPLRGGTSPAVPVTAIVEGRGMHAFVYTLAADKQHVVRHAIQVDTLRPDGVVLVRHGLDGIDHIIDAGASYLDPEAVVSVTPAPAPSSKGGAQ